MVRKTELRKVRPKMRVASYFCRLSQNTGTWQKLTHLSVCERDERESQYTVESITNGTEESVSEVSSFQKLKCMQEWLVVLGGKSVLS